MHSNRILFAQDASAENFNAQAKNAQYILRYWQTGKYRPTIGTFTAPDAGVASNPNVDVVPVRGFHLCRVLVFLLYMRDYCGIFSPRTFQEDWLAIKVRYLLGQRIPLIATFEGLLDEKGNEKIREEYSILAGHEVYTQNIEPAPYKRWHDITGTADHVIAISPFLARLAAPRWGSKVSTLPLGVDLDVFRRSACPYRQRRLRVVGCGRLFAGKRPELFVTLAKIFPQLDFVWFGDGELREILGTKAKNAGLGNLTFPGAFPPNALAKELAASDVFIMPSLGEGVPKVTQEAAACGLAQIVFGFYETPTVIHGQNGFVVWNDDELVRHLKILVETPDLIPRMGDAGMRMAQQWSWSLVAPRWEKKIVEVFDELGRRPSKSQYP